MLIVLSGVSGSGKNTVIDNLIKNNKNFRVFKSATTRKARNEEKKKGVYIFLSEEEFNEKIRNNQFFEYEKVHDNFYGILKDQLELVSKNKELNYIRDIDVNGNIKLRNYFPRDEILSIFLDAPDEILKERLIKRGEKKESIEKRLARAEFERKHKKDYDLIIENLNLENTLNIICNKINSIKNKVD